MKPINFAGANVVFAKDQPQYLPLPAYIEKGDPEGKVSTVWQLSAEELEKIQENGGKIELCQLTFGKPFQPVKLSVYEPENNQYPKSN